jgi:hypothetical protein
MPVKHVADSWYDLQLATDAGEQILADIDSAGIDALRKNQLIWSGWDADVDHGWRPGSRLIALKDPAAIQLFFLSLAWRAAASDLPAMDLVSLEPEVLEDLRGRVATKDPGRFEDYPVVLHQIVTKGFEHNRVPLLEFAPGLPLRNGKLSMMRRIRFYFDGLVGHLYLRDHAEIHDDFMRDFTIGGGALHTVVVTHTFEKSRAYANILEMIRAGS